MSIFDKIFGTGKKKEEAKKAEQPANRVDEEVARQRREQLAARQQEAEEARKRAEESERQRLAALEQAKNQAAQAARQAEIAKAAAEAAQQDRERIAAQAKAAEPRIYIVKDDDYLSKIAKEVYGDAHRWPEIYEANKDVIGANPNIIHGGQKLRIP
jgi:nucleoid-associated protein YgaU